MTKAEAMAAARKELASRGGKACAAKMTDEERIASARRAGLASAEARRRRKREVS